MCQGIYLNLSFCLNLLFKFKCLSNIWEHDIVIIFLWEKGRQIIFMKTSAGPKHTNLIFMIYFNKFCEQSNYNEFIGSKENI